MYTLKIKADLEGCHSLQLQGGFDHPQNIYRVKIWLINCTNFTACMFNIYTCVCVVWVASGWIIAFNLIPFFFVVLWLWRFAC